VVLYKGLSETLIVKEGRIGK